MDNSASVLQLDASWVDYTLIAIYFVFVLGIGLAARRKVSSSCLLYTSDAADEAI